MAVFRQTFQLQNIEVCVYIMEILIKRRHFIVKAFCVIFVLNTSVVVFLFIS